MSYPAKDLFSDRSSDYAKFRPVYPPSLYELLKEQSREKTTAWDCGTGNGQVAEALASFFSSVCATDISRSQIDQAPQLPNIAYSVQPAEKTDFPDRHFDLITVAQAIHWFDFEAFYEEVRRTSKPGALLAIIGYGGFSVDEIVDSRLADFRKNIIAPYWDKERKYVDEEYRTIPFPFEEIPAPHLAMEYEWTMEHLLGYLNTWSAVKHFIKEQGFNPVLPLAALLQPIWTAGKTKTVRFPIFLRLGRLNG